MAEIHINEGLQRVAQPALKAEFRTDMVLASQIEIAQRAFDQFLGRLSDVLPGYLLTPAEIRSVGTEQLLLSEALERDENGNCTIWFTMQPFQCHLRLELGRNFVGSALESVLGAPSEAAGSPRECLTDVDLHILRDLIDLMAEELKLAWLPTAGYSLERVSTELSSTLDGSQAEDPSMVLLTGQIAMRECSGAIRLMVPSLLLRLLSAVGTNSETNVDKNRALVLALGAASLEVQAVLDGARIQFRDLLGLQAGKILQLPHKMDAAIECHVSGIAKFRGELVSSGKALGLQIQ